MANQTITIPKKEYKELIRLREKLDFTIKRAFIKEKKPPKAKKILHLIKLKIKGGPKDLSEKVNFYLYKR